MPPKETPKKRHPDLLRMLTHPARWKPPSHKASPKAKKAEEAGCAALELLEKSKLWASISVVEMVSERAREGKRKGIVCVRSEAVELNRR